MKGVRKKLVGALFAVMILSAAAGVGVGLSVRQTAGAEQEMTARVSEIGDVLLFCSDEEIPCGASAAECEAEKPSDFGKSDSVCAISESLSEETLSEAAHTWEYTVEGTSIRATCTNPAHEESTDGARVITATLNAPEDAAYTGEAIAEETLVTVDGDAFPGGYYIDYYQFMQTVPWEPADYVWVMECRAAGQYRVTLTAMGDSSKSVTVEFEIKKATLRMKIDSARVEYGEETVETALSYLDGIVGEDAQYSKDRLIAAAKETAGFDFGGYRAGMPVSERGITVTATVTDKLAEYEDLSNYDIVFESCPLEITPRRIIVTLTFARCEYGKASENWANWVTAEVIRYGFGFWYAGDDAADESDLHILGLSYTLEGLEGDPCATTAAGDYTVVPHCGNENYEAIWEYGKGGDRFTVSKAKVTVALTVPEAHTYGDIGKFEAALGGVVNGDDVRAVLSFGGQANDGTKFPENSDMNLLALAGKYTVRATGLTGQAAGNYEIERDGETDFEIERATVERPEADPQTYIYNGKEQIYTVVGGDAEHFEVAAGSNVRRDANEEGYEVTVSLTDKSNRIWAGGADGSEPSTEDLTFLFKIMRKQLAAEWSGSDHVYDGSGFDSPTARAETGIAGEREAFLLDVVMTNPSGGIFRDRGLYEFTAAFRAEDGEFTKNYKLKEDTITRTYEIAPAENGWKEGGTLTLEGWTYGDAPHVPTATPKFGDAKDVVFTYTRTDDENGPYYSEQPTDAGTYWVKAHIGDLGNYAEYTETKQFTIARRAIGVTWEDRGPYEYSGEALAMPEASAEGVHGERFVLEVFIFAHPAWGKDGEFLVAGDAYLFEARFDPAAANADRAANYTLNAGTARYAVSVSRKKVTAEWGSETYTYRGEEIPREEYPKATADGGKVTLTVTLEGEAPFRNAGTYTFTAALGDDEHNYELTGIRERGFEIGRAQLTVKWPSGSAGGLNFIYGSVSVPAATVDGLNEDRKNIALKVTMTASVEGTFPNVGRYLFQAEFGAEDRALAENYDLAGAEQEYGIVRAHLTAELSARVVYGDKIGEENVTVILHANELKNGDDEAEILRAVYEAAKGFFRYGSYRAGVTDTGSTKAIVSVDADGKNFVETENYTVTFADGTVTVTPRKIRVTLSGARSNVYGDATHGEILANAVRDGGGEWYANDGDAALLKEEEGLEYAFCPVGDAGAARAYGRRMAAGGYTVAVKLTGELAKNYELVGTEGADYTVTRRGLTVNVTAEVVYGDALGEDNVALSLTAGSGLVAGDRAEEILAEAKEAAAFVFSGYRAGETGVGDRITVTAAAAGIANYVVTYASAEGNLTVAPRQIKVTLGGRLQHIYGDVPVRPAFGADGAALPTLRAVRVDGEGIEMGGTWYGNAADREKLMDGAAYVLEGGESRAFDGTAPAGGYTLRLTWEDRNYQVAAEGVLYRVEKANLAVEMEARVVYGDGIGREDVTVTVADEGELKNGDRRAEIEEAAWAAANFDFGGYTAGMSVSHTGIKVNATGELLNYRVTYAECALVIEQREITARADMVRTFYTGHGQAAAVSFENLYEGDRENFAPVRDYTIVYSSDGAGAFDGGLPLAAGRYFAEIGLTMSEVAANYALVGERRFGYEIAPAAIEENFTAAFEKSRSALYSADSAAAEPLELPTQGTAAFPLVLQGNDEEIVNRVTLRYIVLSHAEGAAHADFVKKIEGYLAQLREGAGALEGVGYAAHLSPVREPKGYCVFFEATAPNHEAYYGYYTLHIYHERLTIETDADGLALTGEYGDVPHTYETLFDLVFGHIVSITATAEDGSLSENKKDAFQREREYFQFYFTEGGREYAIGDLLDANKTYTLNVRYSKADEEDEENFIEFVWGGGKAPTMTVTPRALVLTLGGSRTHEYGAEAFGNIEADVCCKNKPNGGVNGAGLIGTDTVAGLGLTYTFALGEARGLSLKREMGIGTYLIEAECGNQNYFIGEVRGATYTVTPKTLRVALTAEVVYGDAPARDNVKAEIAGGLASWDEARSAAIAEAVYGSGNYVFDGYIRGTTHAGDEGVTVRAESVAVGNYLVIFAAGKVNIAPRTIKVTLSGGTNVYGAERHGNITASAVRTDAEGNEIGGTWYGNADDTLGFIYRFIPAGGAAAEYFRTMEVGTYSIAVGWENGDYRIVAVAGAENAYTVTRATLGCEIPAGGQYDGTARTLLETLTGAAGETLRRGTDYDVYYGESKYDGTDDGILPKNAGQYLIRIALKGEAERNYALAADRFFYIIERRELKAPTGSDLTVIYDGGEHALGVDGFDGTVMTASGDGVNPRSARVTAKNVGKYTVTINIKDLANDCWAGGAQDAVSFTLTVAPAEIGENEKFDAMKERDFLYDPSGAAHDLALPNQSSENFPFNVPGGDAVRIFYLVTEFAEGDHDRGGIEDFLQELRDGLYAEAWHTADATMRVNTPGGYCVYIKIESPNHNSYYGYYTVYIYHEEITIYLDESIVDGHFHNVEYGDAAHTQSVLRERLFEHIREVVAGTKPEEGTPLKGKLDERYFSFYLIDEAGAVHELAETDSGVRLPVGTYKIGVRYLKDGEESHYILFHWHGGQPDFTIVARKIDLTASFEGHIYGGTPAALPEQVTLSAVRSGGAEGSPFAKSGETFESLGLTYSLWTQGGGMVSLGAHMDAGSYRVQIDWDDPNYEVTLIPTAYTVHPRTLTADFRAFDDLTYGGANDPEAFLLGGILWNDEVGIAVVSYSGTVNDGTPYLGIGLPTLAGDYTVTVKLVGAMRENYALIVSTHDFTIGRAVYDMSGVTFEDGVFKGDGSAHGLAATGLPDGVTAHYTGNGRTEPGVYEVVAYFTGDENNYEEIPARSATLTILRMTLEAHPAGDERGASPEIVVESAEGMDPSLQLRAQRSGELERAVTTCAAFGGVLAGVYDLGLYRDGAKVETAGAFTVRLRISEELRGKRLRVFAVRGDGAEVTEISYTLEGDSIVIHADGLSPIAVSYESDSLGAPIGIVSAALLLGIVAMAFEIRIIRKKRKAG